ncbi:MAG: glycosyltransferase family 4 protein [Patescibacteria group bacterium]
MNILIINLDKAIFSDNSASLARLKKYSRLVDKMFVIVWTVKAERPIIFQDKLFIYPTNSLGRLGYFFDSFKIVRHILKSYKIDLVFTQDPFETGLCGWLIAYVGKLKLQLQFHTDVFSPYFRSASLANKLRVILAKFLLTRADSFRVVSERIRRSLLKLKVPAEKIFVLPIFTDIDKFVSSPIRDDLKKKYPQFDFIILMASRFSKEKNINLAIDAMVEIIKQNSKTGLIIAGAGSEKENLRLKIKNLKLRDNVILEPWAHDLASYYKSADLFLLTSDYEGWGMSVVEAMASGCPVVMTDVGCAGELVINNATGMVAPVGNQAAMNENIIKLMENSKLREEIKNKALSAVRKLSSQEEYLTEYKKSWELAIKK